VRAEKYPSGYDSEWKKNDCLERDTGVKVARSHVRRNSSGYFMNRDIPWLEEPGFTSDRAIM
jgi:hypothetical protein